MILLSVQKAYKKGRSEEWSGLSCMDGMDEWKLVYRLHG